MSSTQSEPSLKFISQIQNSFVQFNSVDDSNNSNENDIDPNELRQVMYSMNLMQKNPFLFNLINTLCDVQNVGKITADELISIIDEELMDDKSKEGIKNIFDVFRKPTKQTISFSAFSDIAKELNDPISEQEIKDLIDKSQMNAKEIDFNEFYQIVNDNNNNEKENNKVVYRGRKKINNVKNNNEMFKEENNLKNKKQIVSYKKQIVKMDNSKDSKDKEEENDEQNIEQPEITKKLNKKHYRKNKSKDSDDEEEKDINKYENDTNNEEIISEKIIVEKRGEENHESDDDEDDQYTLKKNLKIETNEEKNENKTPKRYHRRYREKINNVNLTKKTNSTRVIPTSGFFKENKLLANEQPLLSDNPIEMENEVEYGNDKKDERLSPTVYKRTKNSNI